MNKVLVLLFLFFSLNVFANKNSIVDTVPIKLLQGVLVHSIMYKKYELPEINGTYLNTGKKNELIQFENIDADFSSKNGRQVFAKIPGVFVYDMDGTGNQVNIASRGLDPHRGWEFNIRKDGIITNSDMYGYPASHYSMPFESIEKIELVRGTGSLQYGAQFGGMLNYISKQADTTKSFGFEFIQSVGSFNSFSSYNAISGKIKKFTYYGYAYFKTRDGFRDAENTRSQAQKLAFEYELSNKISVQFDWSRSAYIYKIPGALNDSMFKENPRQATRSRNYFNPDIHLPSVKLNWEINENSKLLFTSSAVLGKRNSVLFDKPVNINDSINSFTGDFNNRQVDIDRFNSYTSELRLMHNYQWLRNLHTIVVGIQYMNNNLLRTQLGKGTTGTDFNLNLVDQNWGRDIHFKTKNIAVFIEQKWSLSQKFSLTSGIRFEKGESKMEGVINYYPSNKIPLALKHEFPLFAFGAQYIISNQIKFYGGYTQAYRPVIFKDLVPGSIYETVDPHIKDASGYNAEIGFKGNWNFFKWDITGFLLKQKNRFGTMAVNDSFNNLITYRTNIGNSINKGLEIFIQADWNLNQKMFVSLFTSTAFMNARYKDASLKVGNENRTINNNKVESAPDFTTRNGLTIRNKLISITILYSYVSTTYADALNTISPPSNTGAVGIVPSYGLVDINTTLQISKQVEWRLNINNLFNKLYFTKRPLFYPGPGIWPSDGLNISSSISFKL